MKSRFRISQPNSVLLSGCPNSGRPHLYTVSVSGFPARSHRLDKGGGDRFRHPFVATSGNEHKGGKMPLFRGLQILQYPTAGSSTPKGREKRPIAGSCDSRPMGSGKATPANCRPQRTAASTAERCPKTGRRLQFTRE